MKLVHNEYELGFTIDYDTNFIMKSTLETNMSAVIQYFSSLGILKYLKINDIEQELLCYTNLCCNSSWKPGKNE